MHASGETFHVEEAQRLAQDVTAMAVELDPDETAAIYDTSGGTLFGERSWTAPELRELAKELLAAVRAAAQHRMDAESSPVRTLSGSRRWAANAAPR